MYAVQKDVWHLTKFEETIVEQLLKWSTNKKGRGQEAEGRRLEILIKTLVLSLELQ